MKHCIVTPDLSGPAINGGIGTYVYHLAAYLSKIRGEDIEILLTIPAKDEEESAVWKRFFRESFDVKLTYLPELPGDFDRRVDCGQYFHQVSIKAERYLRGAGFDYIHFQDWVGLGFVTMQAKRAGLAHQETTLTLTMHSNTEWFGEGGKHFFPEGIDNMLLEYCERYCVEHADLLMSPSQYMFDWAERHAWKLSPNRHVVPNLMETRGANDAGSAAPVVSEERNWRPRQLIFFGRLETRKGLGVFLKALSLLKNAGTLEKIERITFLGRVWQLHGEPADDAIRDHFEENLTGARHELITKLDHNAAMAYLRKQRDEALVLIPSLVDNFPYTVLECLELSLHFAASRVGGIPEMMEGDCLFNPTPAALAEIIQRALAGSLSLPKTLYNQAEAERKIVEVLQANRPAGRAAAVAPSPAPAQPDTTICVTHYNYGDVLPDLLKSLESQTDGRFTVVVVDDGSTQPESRETFRALKEKYSGRGWRFIEQKNGGLAQARNSAASHAETPWLLFMDADNVADPRMVEVYRAAMLRGNADCFTCYMSGFENDFTGKVEDILFHYTPYGPCIEAAPIFNILGDANCIIAAEVFRKLGGFNEDRHASFEDYEFFIKLALSGFRLEVAPEFLFYYRVTPGGFSRVTNDYDNRMRGLRPILESLEPWQRRFVINTVGLHEAHHQLQIKYSQALVGRRKKRGAVSQMMRDVEESFRRKLLRPLKKKLKNDAGAPGKKK